MLLTLTCGFEDVGQIQYTLLRNPGDEELICLSCDESVMVENLTDFMLLQQFGDEMCTVIKFSKSQYYIVNLNFLSPNAIYIIIYDALLLVTIMIMPF